MIHMFMKKSNIMISHEQSMKSRVHITFDMVTWEGDQVDMGIVAGGE